MNRKYLRALVVLLAGVFLWVGISQARTRKGEKALKDGKAAEARMEWDAALEFYEQAVEQDPSDVSYLLAMRRARFQAGQKHVDAGEKLRVEGKLEEAVQEFQKALVADPSSSIALQQLKRIQDMMRAPQSAASVEDRGLTPAERARRESTDKVSSMLAPPELKPMTQVLPMLKMNNQSPRVLYETVGKLAGVNVVFDAQYNAGGRNYNVDLTNSSVEQAFDYLSLLTRTFWKPTSANTIFVAEDNVTKRRDFEDDVVRVFYVTNATSVQEFQEIATAVRTVAEIRRVFTYNAQRAMIVRDTVDKVSLAEKLIHDLDKPKSEVVVDVIVMEANSQRTRDLAATLVSAGTAGLSVPITFTPGGTTTTSGSTTTTTTTTSTTPATITLNRLGSLSTRDFSTTLPGAMLKAMLSDSRTKVLNNPQVRASDGQKVTLKIGNRIPYATGSFQTNTAAALVSTQFNYADVGVNVDMTPQVHSSDEVTLHLEVSVSSVQQYVDIGGISQPVIGQRTNTADIRLREGEVNILGGLSSTQDTNTVNGIPGLVNIPILGKAFFASNSNTNNRGDLMIALIPHIIRTPDYTAENLRGIYAGTDQVVKLNYAVKATSGAAPVPVPRPAAPGNPAAAPAPVPPVAVPAPTAIPLAPRIPFGPQPGASSMPVPATSGQTRVVFAPSHLRANEGGTVTVSLQLENAADLSAATPVRIKFDPEHLRLDDITAGDLLSRGGVVVNAVKDIRNDVGEATFSLTRAAGAPGITGDGALALLRFTVTGGGEVPVSVSEIRLLNAMSQPVPAALGQAAITVE
jgi:general secretion pathway protein D